VQKSSLIRLFTLKHFKELKSQLVLGLKSGTMQLEKKSVLPTDQAVDLSWPALAVGSTDHYWLSRSGRALPRAAMAHHPNHGNRGPGSSQTHEVS